MQNEQNEVVQNIALARRLAEHPSGKFQDVFDHASKDIILECTISRNVPGSGVHRGKDAVIDFLTKTRNELVEDVRIESPLQYFGDRGRVIVLGKESYLIRRTRHRASEHFAMALDFRGGQLAACLIIQNTTDLANAYR